MSAGQNPAAFRLCSIEASKHLQLGACRLAAGCAYLIGETILDAFSAPQHDHVDSLASYEACYCFDLIPAASGLLHCFST